MKKEFLLILLIVISCHCQSQNNLVGNPGFETHVNCGECPQPNWGNYTTQFNWWSGASPWGIPHLRDFCFAGDVGSPDLLCTGGHNQPSYGVTKDFGEYIVQYLGSPLISNHLYYIEFYAKPKTGTAFAGLHFNMDRPRECHNRWINRFGFGEPNVPIPSNYSDDQWHKISVYWEAKANFQYMTAGNIRQADESIEMGWDDFLIVDVGDGWCTSINRIQDLTFHDVQGIIYRSNQLTIAGNNVGAPVPVGDVHISSTASVVYQSETEVALMPGFHTDPNSRFDAIIAPCSSAGCAVPSAYIGADDEYCNQAGQQIQLGGPAGDNETYQWTTTGKGGVPVNVLSSTTISDPILTIPPGSGAIDITEVATSGCDGSSNSDKVTVYYDNNPDPNSVVHNVSPSNINAPQGNNTANFTITGDAHTEEIHIILFDVTGGAHNPIEEWNFDDFPNNSNSNFEFNFSTTYANFANCKKYDFEVTSFNICSNTESQPLHVTWQSPSTGIGGVSVDGGFSQPNGCLHVYAAEIASYSILVKDQYGTTVYQGSGYPSGANPFCVWEGQCNQCYFGNHLDDDTYYYIIDLYNFCGVHFNAANSVGMTGRIGNPNDTTQNDTIHIGGGVALNEVKSKQITVKVSTTLDANLTASMQVYPNPAKDLFNVNFDNTTFNSSKVSLLEIYDYAGNIVYQKSNANQNNGIDLSNFQNGIYTVIAYGEKETMRKSFMVQR